MTRNEILLEGITKEMLGIELGPFHSPLVPKRSGYRSLGLDVFDLPRLREIATGELSLTEGQVAQIEEVDLLGPAMDIERLVNDKGLLGKIDYIISSHNFEHFPDPIRFLQGCANVLRPGGRLIMAIPDRRGCFDYFRPFSTTSSVLSAYAENLKMPSPEMWLEGALLQSRRNINEHAVGSWNYSDPGNDVYSVADVLGAWKFYQEMRGNEKRSYIDAHCWVFMPSIFEIIIRDLQHLELVSLRLDSISEAQGHEFYVRLVNDPVCSDDLELNFMETRNTLLRRSIDEFRPAKSINDGIEAERPRADCSALRAELDSCYASTSWQITAPLRALRRLIG